MADLTEEMQDAIVRRLARFETPTNVARAVGEEFDVEISRRQVAAYNVGTASFEGAQKWVYVFDAERAAYRKELEQHAISDVGFRLGMLQRGALAAEARGNYVLAAQLLKQAAEDVGGAYSNERRVSGKIDHNISRPATADEARRELAMRIENARKVLPSKAPAALPASEQVIEG